MLLNTTDNPKYHLILDERNQLILGILTTLWVSVGSLVLSVALGFVLFLMMKSKMQFIKAIAVIFKEIVMGTPLLVMVFLTVYVLGTMIDVTDKQLLGVVALTLYTGPYICNAYQSAIEIIDADQYKVMALYHFTAFQKYRYIIFPQMIKPLIPSLINTLSSTIKGSALLKVVSRGNILCALGNLGKKLGVHRRISGNVARVSDYNRPAFRFGTVYRQEVFCMNFELNNKVKDFAWASMISGGTRTRARLCSTVSRENITIMIMIL